MLDARIDDSSAILSQISTLVCSQIPSHEQRMVLCIQGYCRKRCFNADGTGQAKTFLRTSS